MAKMHRFRGAIGKDGVSVAAWAPHAFTTRPQFRNDPSLNATDATRPASTWSEAASPLIKDPPNAFAPGSRFKFGSISLTLGTDNITMSISEAGGAVGGLGGVDLMRLGQVEFLELPEPTTALLVGLGLIGLGVRRRSLT